MRTEKQMYDLIINTAKEDDRVRAVIISGSRCNPNAPNDEYQDYDIAYVVRDITSFKKDHSWIKIFGNPLMVQMLEQYKGAANDGRFNYLMLFDDGNRIDLILIPIEKFDDIDNHDSLNKVLLDKDNIVGKLTEPSDSDYYIKQPTEILYDQYCNNFWWIMQNTAKGIMREEISYAMKMLSYSRDCLDNIISWNIGIKNGFNLSVGKFGKYFRKYLDEDVYDSYCKAYPNSDYENIWKSIFVMCELFPPLAKEVAEHFRFEYKESYEKNMMEYLHRVKVKNYL